jgi:predicted  nucleic acid-binding Zn-ribbon protein
MFLSVNQEGEIRLIYYVVVGAAGLFFFAFVVLAIVVIFNKAIQALHHTLTALTKELAEARLDFTQAVNNVKSELKDEFHDVKMEMKGLTAAIEKSNDVAAQASREFELFIVAHNAQHEKETKLLHVQIRQYMDGQKDLGKTIGVLEKELGEVKAYLRRVDDNVYELGVKTGHVFAKALPAIVKIENS